MLTWSKLAVAIHGALALALLLACAGPSDPAPGAAPAARWQAPPLPAGAATGATDATAGPDPIAYSTIDDPQAMAALEGAGARFDDLVSNDWQSVIAGRLGLELGAIARADPNAGVGIRGNSHRLFDRRWLRDGHYELIGLTYRSERIAIDPERCGDVRLIYRLAYRAEVSKEPVHSRLPMTVLVELAAARRDAQSGCANEARRWQSKERLSGQALGLFLQRGPLRDRLRAAEVTQILVNAQVVRWPSSVRPSLGGHAEYSMLAFAPSDDRKLLRVQPLENMPDVDALRRTPALRADLVQWIGQHLDGIDDGTALLPGRFLATSAVSVTPRGLSRRSNRPYRQVFSADDFSEMDLNDRRRIGSPEALLRRLDDMSCVGCHQSRTIAGFHWLGVDGPDVAPGNALFVSRSVPLVADARRRDAYILQVARGAPADFSRPFAERDDADPGIVGSRCGLGDPGFAAWTCAEGLVCDAYDAPRDDAIVGVCTSPGPAGQGDFCEAAAIRVNDDAHRDQAGKSEIRACAHGVCNINRTGFPGGMCTSSCEDMPAEGGCGVIAVLTPFNNCLARKTPFPRCLAEHVRPAGLRACDQDRPCRDDYVCATTPAGDGACMPPYFLFQLRVDGHP